MAWVVEATKLRPSARASYRRHFGSVDHGIPWFTCVESASEHLKLAVSRPLAGTASCACGAIAERSIPMAERRQVAPRQPLICIVFQRVCWPRALASRQRGVSGPWLGLALTGWRDGLQLATAPPPSATGVRARLRGENGMRRAVWPGRGLRRGAKKGLRARRARALKP